MKQRIATMALALVLVVGTAGRCTEGVGNPPLKCKDGTTSNQTSHHRQGACSGHGGVA